MTLLVLLQMLIVFAVGAVWFFRARQWCAFAASVSSWNWQRRLVLHPTYVLGIRITGAMFMAIGAIGILSDLVYMVIVRI